MKHVIFIYLLFLIETVRRWGANLGNDYAADITEPLAQLPVDGGQILAVATPERQ